MLQGFIKIGESFRNTMLLPGKIFFDRPTQQFWVCVVISMWTLVRFFFAPYKNMRRLIEEKPRSASPFYYSSILLFDMPVLLLPSIWFYEIGRNIQDCGLSLFYFYLLLLTNVVWLFLIKLRLKKDSSKSAKGNALWKKNNAVCLALAGFSLLLFPDSNSLILKIALLLIALMNCLVDIRCTHDPSILSCKRGRLRPQ